MEPWFVEEVFLEEAVVPLIVVVAVVVAVVVVIEVELVVLSNAGVEDEAARCRRELKVE